MKNKDIKFYLDPTELLNKPRRLFTGLKLHAQKFPDIYMIEYSDGEKAHKLLLEIIDDMEKEFYKTTLPKFQSRIDGLYDL